MLQRPWQLNELNCAGSVYWPESGLRVDFSALHNPLSNPKKTDSIQELMVFWTPNHEMVCNTLLQKRLKSQYTFLMCKGWPQFRSPQEQPNTRSFQIQTHLLDLRISQPWPWSIWSSWIYRRIIKIFRRFGGTYSIHLQGQGISWRRNEQKQVAGVTWNTVTFWV
jgi:hypothetical protein